MLLVFLPCYAFCVPLIWYPGGALSSGCQNLTLRPKSGPYLLSLTLVFLQQGPGERPGLTGAGTVIPEQGK